MYESLKWCKLLLIDDSKLYIFLRSYKLCGITYTVVHSVENTIADTVADSIAKVVLIDRFLI